jgi:hypothetical protein
MVVVRQLYIALKILRQAGRNRVGVWPHPTRRFDRATVL